MPYPITYEKQRHAILAYDDVLCKIWSVTQVVRAPDSPVDGDWPWPFSSSTIVWMRFW